MASFLPQELSDHLKYGLLSFPATAFTDDFALDASAYSTHIAWQSSFDVAGLFAAGGTGEGFSLTPAEAKEVVNLAVSASRAEVPVLGSATGSTAQAVRNAIDAEAAGAEGLLVLPPYLTEASQEGLYQHVSAICSATKIGVIVYNRANAVYAPETVERLADAHSNFIGFKDAIGNIEHLTKLYARTGDRLFYLGGLPTAELYALPLLQLGMSTYSSALFNFAPEFALEFYAAVRRQDRTAVVQKLNDFVLPYSKVRERVPGYGVSIVKGGLKVIGRDCGPVRPPLQNLTETDLQDLEQVMSAAGIRFNRTASAVA